MNFASIVMIPGLLCTDDLFRDQISALSGRNVSIADTSQDATITGMAERLLADAPDEFALCGLSMGGYVALEVIRQAPGRVKAVVLMATSHRNDTPEQIAARRRLIAFGQEHGIEAVARQLAGRLLAPGTANDSLRQRIVAMALSIGFDGFVRQQEAIIGRANQSGILSRIDVPVTIVAGTADAIIAPERSREMAEAIPGAKLEMLPDVGHMVTMEAPDRANAILLRGLSLPPAD
ncbi:alpha/beta fold hydrolase [Aurantimonas sp. A2-1-M11]|uniref:alpha/beta fold hydrolase n=1 Tax=Aurantimonas sp. A2-1-M11 TaxID=3113712 RepID=UPI002F93BC89